MDKDNIKKFIGKKIADRYYITGEIGSGGMGKVFKAIPFDDPSRYVAIKVIHRNRELNSEDLLRFQKEAALMGRLNHQNIVCLYELGLLDEGIEENQAPSSFEHTENAFSKFNPNQNPNFNSGINEPVNNYGYYIVMELANGMNLKECLHKYGRKDLAFFFQVGLQITSALDYTHGKNIIHRDIKPQNIIVGDSGTDNKGILVKILDFGVARLAESLNSGEVTTKKVDTAGTPLYMAPEQTKLLNEPIDHRVDLYSLGCVLYEILAGKPPFTATSREKLEQQHAFSKPELLTNIRPDIPPIISDIVHKLLCKSPKQRYHTAFALHADLARVKRKLERRENPAHISFELGVYDRFKSVSSAIKMVGWNTQLEMLENTYKMSSESQGRSQVALVEGEYGSGKTKLLTEFRNYLNKHKAKYISVNFSQHENALPFNALANGFNDYLLKISKTSIYESNEFKKKVKSLLGSVAYDVAKIVPGITPFISKDIENLDKDPLADFKTFVKSFTDFTKCFSNSNDTIVFIFDDIHLADEKSLELIEYFVTHNNSQKFCLILSGDISEISQNKVHLNFIEKFKKLKRRFHEINLDHLQREDTKSLIQDMLQTQDEVPAGLLDYMAEKCQGNPLYIIEFIRTLVSKDLIRYSLTKKVWEYNIGTILNKNIQPDSIDLVINKIKGFSDIEKDILNIASIVGMNFNSKLLCVDDNLKEDTINSVLQSAVDRGLIYLIKNEESYSLGSLYSFIHWKVRETLYMFIDPLLKRNLYYKIAEKLNENLNPNSSVNLIFAVAHYINNSFDGLKIPSLEKAKKYVFYNVRAANYARMNGSWMSAQRYYENAYNQIVCWPKESFDISLVADIIEALGDILALQKKHGDALNKYTELYKMNISVSKMSSIVHKIVYLHAVGGYLSKSISLIKSYLIYFKHNIVSDNVIEYIKYIFSIISDVFPRKFTKHKIYNKLKVVYEKYLNSRSNNNKTEIHLPVKTGSFQKELHESYLSKNIDYCIYKLYDIGHLVSLNIKGKLARLYETIEYKFVMSKDTLDITVLLKVFALRAGVLGNLGFYKISYKIFDLVMDISRGLGFLSVYGYCALQRAITVDYIRSKYEDISYNLRSALRYMSIEEDRLWFVVATQFDAFRSLLKGNIRNINNYVRNLPDIIPTRNWLGPRVMAISFFMDLLADYRENLVTRGERYLARRYDVSGRDSDIFMYMIKVIICFVKGELDKTRKNYIYIIEDYLSKNSIFLFTHEKDLLLLFLIVFPDLFEQEYGRKLMRTSESKALYKKLYRSIRFSRIDRSIILLAKARCSEILNLSKVKELYDKALKSSKAEGNQIVQIFSYIWFGSLLINQKSIDKKRYIKKAHQISATLSLKSMVSYCEKIMDKFKIEYKRTKTSNSLVSVSSKYSESVNPIVLKNLFQICSYFENVDFSLQRALQDSFKLLSEKYKYKNIYCIKLSYKDPVILYSTTNAHKEDILHYAEFYINIRSSLFIPVASFDKNEGDLSFNLSYNSFDSSSSSSSSSSKEDLTGDKTLVLATNNENDNVNGSGGVKSVGSIKEKSTDDENIKTEDLQKYSYLDDEYNKDVNDISTKEDIDLSMNSTVNKSQYRQTLTSHFSKLGKQLTTNKGSNNLDYTVNRKQEEYSMISTSMNALVPLRSKLGNIGLLFIEDVNLAGKDVVQCRNELDIFGTQIRLLIEKKIDSFTETSFVHDYKQKQDPIYTPGSFSLEDVSWLKLYNYGELRKKRETTWYLGLSFDEDYYMLAYCKLNGNLEIREKLGSILWNYFLTERSLSIYGGKTKFDLKEIKEDISYLLSTINGVKNLDSISISVSFFDNVSKSVVSGHFGSARPIVLNRINRIIPQNEAVLNFTNGSDLRYWDIESELVDGSIFILSYDTSKLELSNNTVSRKAILHLQESETIQAFNDRLSELVSMDSVPRYYVAIANKEIMSSTLENSDIKKSFVKVS